MSSARTKPPLTGSAAFSRMFGLSVLAGAFAGVGSIFANDIPGPTGLALSLAVNSAAMTAAVIAGVWWWRRIDEAAREAHKWAWWWGGSTGMTVGGVILLTALSRKGGFELGAVSFNEVLAIGMTLMLTCQLLGYTVAWAVWWAKRR